jgi:HPt (histidine-containing phosphotransfer) domain-containing protein
METIRYDITLMDVQMPEMDGLEATRRIRVSKSVLNPKIPIIAMTANAMQGDREKCLDAGMDDYISKPVSRKTLAEKLEKWLPAKPAPVSKPREITMGANLSPKTIAVPQTPVFDRKSFLDRMMGDREMAEKIVEVFLDDIPKQLESLKQALDACDPETFQRVVHSIKGAAANVSGEALRELAAEVEKACKEGKFDSVSSRGPELEQQFDRLKEEMKKEI